MEFVDIPGYEGMYKINKKGEIWSNYWKIFLKPINNGKGYMFVNLCKNKIHKQIYIHRLVALTFISNVDNKPEVNHKDGNKQNNCVENLEWVTSSENDFHAYRTGLRPPWTEKQKESSRNNGRKGSFSMRATTEEQNEFIKFLYKYTKITQKKLGEQFGVSEATINRIIHNKLYQEVN